jgi:hypothetical protein
MTISQVLGAYVAIVSVVNILPLPVHADTMTIGMLVSLDTVGDGKAVVDRIRSISLSNCLVANVASLSSDKVVVLVQCDDGIRNPGSAALERIGQLPSVKQAMIFFISRP